MIVYTYLVVRYITAGERNPTKSLPPSYQKNEPVVMPIVNAYIVNSMGKNYPQR